MIEELKGDETTEVLTNNPVCQEAELGKRKMDICKVVGRTNNPPGGVEITKEFPQLASEVEPQHGWLPLMGEKHALLRVVDSMYGVQKLLPQCSAKWLDPIVANVVSNSAQGKNEID